MPVTLASDDFESPALGWNQLLAGAGASVDLSQVAALSGIQSVLVTAGSDDDAEAEINRTFVDIDQPRVYGEIFFQVATVPRSITLTLDFKNGLRTFRFRIFIDFESDQLQLLNSAFGLSLFRSPLPLDAGPGSWNRVRLTVNPQTGAYNNLDIDGTVMDLTTFTAPSFADASAPQTQALFLVTSTVGSNGAVFLDDFGLVNDRPTVTCSQVRRTPLAENIILSGETTGVEFFEQVDLVATIENDDGRRDNIEWRASSGLIVDQDWNTATWQAPNFETPALVDIFIDGQIQLACRSEYQTPFALVGQQGAVSALHVERAPRNSGDVLSTVSTLVTPGEVISLVATILNDDGRRDNIEWEARFGQIEAQVWDQAVYTAPFVTTFDEVDIIIDGAVQHGAKVLFSIPTAPPVDSNETPLQDFLQIDWWKTQANKLSDVRLETAELLPNKLDDVLGFLTGKADQIRVDVGSLPDQFTSALVPVFGNLVDQVQANVSTAIIPIFGAQFNPIQAALEALPIPSPQELWDTFWAGAEEFLSPVIRTGVNIFLESLEQAFVIIGGPLWDRLLQVPDLDSWVRTLLEQLANPTDPAAAFLGQAAAGSTVSGSITGIIAPTLRAVEYFANTNRPNVILDSSQLATARAREFIDQPEFIDELLKHGFDETKGDVLLRLAINRLDPGLINQQVLRFEMQEAASRAGPLAQGLVAGFDAGMSPEAGDILLRDLGFQGRAREQVLDQRKTLPQVQDLIRFAVREAFNTDLIDRLNLDDEFPNEIVPFTRGQGLPDTFATMFWRAHWEIPSIQQGFEMLHRSFDSSQFADTVAGSLSGGQPNHTVIDDEGLDLLFREADILPFWRERLKAISFQVISRIDVRRMYDLDVFDLEDVERTYRSLGYTEDDARFLTQFVEKNAIQPRLTARNTEARQQYRDGLIDRDQAEALLTPLIPLQAELEAELVTLDLDRQGTRLTREVTAWQTSYRKQQISEAEFRGELTRLTIPAEEIDFRVTITDIARVAEDPSSEQEELRAAGRGIVIRRFREGMIDQAQFALEMSTLGYSDLQIGQFSTQADLEFETNVSLDLLSAYRSGLRSGRLAETEFRALVQDLGIRPELIDAYVSFDELRRKLEGPTLEEAEVRAFGSGPVLSRFQEGWTSEPEFQLEMESLGYTSAEVDRYQLVADLRFDLDFKNDSLVVLRSAFNRRIIDGDEFVGRLATLGMDSARAAVHLAREQLRLLDREEAPEITPGDVELPIG